MVFPNRCVNCTITFTNPRIVSQRLVELDTTLRKLLTSWISQIELSSESKVCLKCIEIIRTQAQEEHPIRDYGHQSVCLGCGVSVLRARSILVNRHRPEFNIIERWEPQIQADLPIFTRYCRVCWRRATRLVSHTTQESYGSDSANGKIGNQLDFQEKPVLNHIAIKADIDPLVMSEDYEVPYQYICVKIEADEKPPPIPSPSIPSPLIPSPFIASPSIPSPFIPSPSIPSPLLAPSSPNHEVVPQQQSIQLPNYKRVAATSRRCVFSDCINKKRKFLKIPLVIRKRLLTDLKIYIPKYTRVCSEHLNNQDWKPIVDENLFDTFTSDQIEDMLDISESNVNAWLDFENIEHMNDRLRHYWIGMNVQQFNNIVNGTPSLPIMLKKYKTALAMYLAKCRTGNSAARLAPIFNISKSSFHRQVTIVRECLDKDCDPSYLRHIKVKDVAENNHHTTDNSS